MEASPTDSIRWTMQSLIEASTEDQLKAVNKVFQALTYRDFNFFKALELDSNFAEAWCHKGNILLRNKSLLEAKECFTHCCNIPFVKQYEAYFKKGIVEMQLSI